MTPDAAPAQPTRTRRTVATVLVVIASLLAFLAILAIWANRQLLNTDNWTRTSSQLLEKPVIRNELSDYLVDQVYANVDVAGQIRAALPPRLQPLAAPAASGLRSLAERQTKDLLERPRAQQAWQNANRSAHLLLLHVLSGGGPAVSTQGGRVVLDLKSVLAQTEQQLGFGGRVAKVLPAGAARIEILRSDQLKAAQQGFRLLRHLPLLLVGLSLALFGVALWIAPGWRRRAVRAYGVGFVIAGVGALVATALIGDAVVSSLARTQAQVPAVEATWSIATSLLRQAAVATIGYGLVMVLGAWLAGPMGSAVAVRRTLAPYLREPVVAYAGLAVLLAVVILWWAPTPATRNPVTALILVALAAVGFEAWRRQAVREFPQADRAATAQRRRERVHTAWAGVRERSAAGAGAIVRQAQAGVPRAGNGDGSGSGEDVRLERLERLSRLHDAGTLDDAEFAAEKARLLARDAAAAPAAP